MATFETGHGEHGDMIADARLLLHAHIPWLAPAVLEVPVHVSRGVGAHSQTTEGAVFLAADDVVVQAKRQNVNPIHLTSIHLLTCLWRVLLRVDARDAVASDTDAWAQAADAVCCRVAVNTALHTDTGRRFLPRAEGMVTPRTLAEQHPVEDPDHISLEDLYLILEADQSEDERDTETPECFTSTADAQQVPDNASQLTRQAVDTIWDQVLPELTAAADHTDEQPDQAIVDVAAAHGHSGLDLRSRFRSVLGAVVSAADGGVVPSYRRPPRVDDPHLMFPGRANTTRRIMVAVDTSPSMSDAELSQAVVEATSAARDRGFEVSYVSVSLSASNPRSLSAGEDLVIERGYGTDMREGFAAFDEQRPDVAVMITDGRDTPWPDAAPATSPVVIAVVGDDSDVRTRVREVADACPWAEVVALPVR